MTSNGGEGQRNRVGRLQRKTDASRQLQWQQQHVGGGYMTTHHQKQDSIDKSSTWQTHIGGRKQWQGNDGNSSLHQG